MREITEIIIHCSATKERSNFKLKDIEGWHKQRGFPLSGGKRKSTDTTNSLTRIVPASTFTRSSDFDIMTL